MGKVVVCLLALALLLAVCIHDDADAHRVVGNSAYLSRKQERRVIHATHRVFAHHPRKAHRAQRYAWCESSLRWWLRGSYWGLFQFDEDARMTYGGHWRDGWTITEQLRSFRRMFAARGPAPWPNCP